MYWAVHKFYDFLVLSFIDFCCVNLGWVLEFMSVCVFSSSVINSWFFFLFIIFFIFAIKKKERKRKILFFSRLLFPSWDFLIFRWRFIYMEVFMFFENFIIINLLRCKKLLLLLSLLLWLMCWISLNLNYMELQKKNKGNTMHGRILDAVKNYSKTANFHFHLIYEIHTYFRWQFVPIYKTTVFAFITFDN